MLKKNKINRDGIVGSRMYHEKFTKFKECEFDWKDKFSSGKPEEFGSDNLQALLKDTLTKLTLELTERLDIDYMATVRCLKTKSKKITSAWNIRGRY